MNQPVIEFQNVSKSFKTWHDRPPTLKALLSNLAAFRFRMGHRESKQVLSNINLSIYPGEFVGFMGRNGTGKSTLLKLISNIYRPTSGKVLTRGRIAPLLELGAGFASDLNGYENILLNGSILGFSRSEIMSKMDSIVEFSELGSNIEQAVRTYSSGMLVRLGFSIAAYLDAQILLFDEILAVGDVGFQEKCLQKIREVHKQGRTIILVTHTPKQVEDFCSRCIVFDHEGVHFDGSAKDGVNSYLRLFQNSPASINH